MDDDVEDEEVERGKRMLLLAISQQWLAFEPSQLALVMKFFATFDHREDADQAAKEASALVERLATKFIRLQIRDALLEKAQRDRQLADELEGGARQDEVMRQRALQHFAQQRGHG